MDAAALLDEDFAAVLSGVQAQIGTDPHQAFVERLGRTDDG
jgi:hypothetical protein